MFDALAVAQLEPHKRYFGKDTAGRYIYANPSFAADAGVDLTFLMGNTDEVCAWSSQADKCREDDQRVMTNKADTLRAETIFCANRVRLKVMLRKLPIYEEGGSVVGCAGLYYPVADHRTDLQLALSLLSPALKAHYNEQREAMGRKYAETGRSSGLWSGSGPIPLKGSLVKMHNAWGSGIVLGYFRDGDEVGLLVSPDHVPDDWEGPVPKVIHVFGVEIVTESEQEGCQ